MTKVALIAMVAIAAGTHVCDAGIIHLDPEARDERAHGGEFPVEVARALFDKGLAEPANAEDLALLGLDADGDDDVAPAPAPVKKPSRASAQAPDPAQGGTDPDTPPSS